MKLATTWVNFAYVSNGKLLDLAGVADHLGVTYKTVRSYHGGAMRRRAAGTAKPGDMPAPDEHFGRTPVWKATTIDRWLAQRPGQGVGGGPRKERT